MDKIKFDGNKLFQIRKEKGLSQEKLALAIGVTRQTIYLWESNQSLPDVEKVSKICKVLEIELSDLVDGMRTETDDLDDMKTKNNKENRRRISKRILLFSLIIISVYMILSIIKFNRLQTILKKWEKLNLCTQYYIKVSEYLINKDDKSNDILENKFYEVYYKDGILKTVFRNLKNEEITSIILKNYDERRKYIIDVKEKTYRVERFDEKEKQLKVIENFQNSLKYRASNDFQRMCLCMRPDFCIKNKDNKYVLIHDNGFQENVNKKTGIIEYEETVTREFWQTKRYYTVELNTDKDFEIHLEDYTEVE